ncbi:MAG: Hsp33 family molecular chaperone HslO [Alphaproteobacteria bacterium]|nr:Hsp33 family molecular chaperone HslO [Alphaproteobacteria bacterium]MDE2336467.1 Hsp33 family molecular chaperone HslO [Alphaproteobacteria bacterium]
MAIRIKKDGTEQSGLVDDDVVQPFRLEKSNVRGRMVRLGPVLAEIMGRHDYPPPVSALLSEVLTLALLLSAMLKYDGVFSLQIKGDGAIRTLVADVTGKGEVRAYAGFDEAAVKKAAKRKKDTDNHYYHLLGKGHMAFTVDAGGLEHRYQGIVELKGSSIIDAAQHYFTQSEQIKTSFRPAVHPQDGHWRTGGIMIQQMPDEDAGKNADDEPDLEDWTRAVMLLSTCSEGEMLSPVLASADVLYRLFHEDGVRVYSPTHVRFKCRCTRARVVEILRTIPRAEIEDICEKEGHVSIKCEFCSEDYTFAAPDLDAVYKGKKP